MDDLLTRDLPGYRLLDSGAGDKLEVIAGHTVVRPSPQAVWRPRREETAWAAAASRCHRTAEGGGYWRHRSGDEPRLTLRWRGPVGTELHWRLRFTAFGHCGVFVEQAPIWEAIQRRLAVRDAQPVFLNLFGYTGCASLAAAAAGARVFHVDSSRGVLDWGQANQRASGMAADAIQWVHEDVRSFLRLSRKRGFRYDGILCDPPSWGHGKRKKETWTFDEDAATLAEACRAVLRDDRSFLIFTCHTPGVQKEALRNLLDGASQAGDLGIAHADDERVLPAGVYAGWW